MQLGPRLFECAHFPQLSLIRQIGRLIRRVCGHWPAPQSPHGLQNWPYSAAIWPIGNVTSRNGNSARKSSDLRPPWLRQSTRHSQPVATLICHPRTWERMAMAIHLQISEPKFCVLDLSSLLCVFPFIFKVRKAINNFVPLRFTSSPNAPLKSHTIFLANYRCKITKWQ